MYISYSGYDLANDCLRAYYHQYIAKTQVTKLDNRVHMLYGEAVGILYQAFYNDGLWKANTTARMLALVKPTIQKVITNEIRKGGTFDWKEKGLKEGTRSIKEVEGEVIETVHRGLRSIRHHRLLGTDAQAEVVLDTIVDGHKIAGRADFVMTRVKPHGDRVIIDGKGSRHRDQYTNHRQLRWYAMLHWLKLGSIPDRLGFLYWRYEPENSLDWTQTTPDALNVLKSSVLQMIGTIEQANRDILNGAEPEKVFPASPKTSGCKFCRYLEVCPEGQRFLSKDRKEEIADDIQRGVEDGGVSF
jgi:hypothetical protein